MILFISFCNSVLVATFAGRVAQRYGTMAVFVVFLHAHVQFVCLIRLMPPSTFSDTVITDRHSDTTMFQLRAHWVRISWSTGSAKIARTCAAGGSRTLNFLRERRTPYPLCQALRFLCIRYDHINSVNTVNSLNHRHTL